MKARSLMVESCRMTVAKRAFWSACRVAHKTSALDSGHANRLRQSRSQLRAKALMAPHMANSVRRDHWPFAPYDRYGAGERKGRRCARFRTTSRYPGDVEALGTPVWSPYGQIGRSKRSTLIDRIRVLVRRHATVGLAAPVSTGDWSHRRAGEQSRTFTPPAGFGPSMLICRSGSSKVICWRWQGGATDRCKATGLTSVQLRAALRYGQPRSVSGGTMKITAVECLHADAGVRTFDFLKVSTDEGIIGWSEYNEAFGGKGVTSVIENLAPIIIGRDPRPYEAITTHLFAIRRQAIGGVDPAGDRCDRERLARHQGEGAGHSGLRDARRPPARPAASLLVALRHLSGGIA